eukprot:scaffold3440_cov316-Prasinococcus_capsulatus_cf.AAC.7
MQTRGGWGAKWWVVTGRSAQQATVTALVATRTHRAANAGDVVHRAHHEVALLSVVLHHPLHAALGTCSRGQSAPHAHCSDLACPSLAAGSAWCVARRAGACACGSPVSAATPAACVKVAVQPTECTRSSSTRFASHAGITIHPSRQPAPCASRRDEPEDERRLRRRQ